MVRWSDLGSISMISRLYQNKTGFHDQELCKEARKLSWWWWYLGWILKLQGAYSYCLLYECYPLKLCNVAVLHYVLGILKENSYSVKKLWRLRSFILLTLIISKSFSQTESFGLKRLKSTLTAVVSPRKNIPCILPKDFHISIWREKTMSYSQIEDIYAPSKHREVDFLDGELFGKVTGVQNTRLLTIYSCDFCT